MRKWRNRGDHSPPGPPLAQSLVHFKLRRLLGRSTARKGVLFWKGVSEKYKCGGFTVPRLGRAGKAARPHPRREAFVSLQGQSIFLR